KSDLRLDHPELGGMSCRIGILRPESRSEGVYVAESKGKGLRLQLPADGETCLLAEELSAVIDLAVFCLWQIFHVQRGHPEHLAGAFTVTAGDDRRVNIDEVIVLEKLVDRIGHQGSDPEYRGKSIAPRTQVGDLTHKFHGMAFFLQR